MDEQIAIEGWMPNNRMNRSVKDGRKNWSMNVKRIAARLSRPVMRGVRRLSCKTQEK